MRAAERSGPDLTGQDDGRRAALRLVPYALYAVTLRRGDEHHGFTANWLTQVSFDPQLMAISVENDSHSIQLLRETHVFTVNVLPAGSREVAGILGRRSARLPDKMSHVAWEPGPNGCAVLEGALGYIECEAVDGIAAGDSTVFIARVTGGRVLREGAPLLMSETGFKHAG